MKHQKSLARVWCHRGRKIQSSCILSLLCMCGGNVNAVWIRLLHTALLPGDIFYVLVLFILYFYCLLNGFFWLCFVWSSVQRKQFCSEKHFANCPEEERAGASRAVIASTILILAVNPQTRISTQSLLNIPTYFVKGWKTERSPYL